VNKSTRRLRRFTLVELVVALAIVSVIGLIIGSASATFYNDYRRTVNKSKQLSEYLAIDRVFDSFVRNMVPFKWNDSENVSRFVFLGEEDELIFTSLRRADGDSPGALIFIRIYLENEELIAEYSYYPRLPWAEEEEIEETPFKREVLCTKVAEVKFTYAEENSEESSGIEWFDYWDEDEHNAIPLALQMRVEWIDGSSEQWLRRSAGNGAVSRFGKREAPPAD
jgi:prepilin-type N-terminal cleavage/methylation domain-containing protein